MMTLLNAEMEFSAGKEKFEVYSFYDSKKEKMKYLIAHHGYLLLSCFLMKTFSTSLPEVGIPFLSPAISFSRPISPLSIQVLIIRKTPYSLKGV